MTTIETSASIDTNYTYREDDFDGYKAAPVLIIGQDADPALIASQDELARNFGKLVYSELGDYARPAVLNFVEHSITSRMSQREGLNGHSYLQRSHKQPDYSLLPHVDPTEIDEACEHLRCGSGTALQNELARVAFGMDSVEYTNLTVIGSARKQLEPAMWNDVSKLVDADATPNPSRMYGHQVLGFDRDIRSSSHIGAMRIGMKRFLGTTEHGQIVKARTTAIINMSPSTGIDSDIVDSFRYSAQHNMNITRSLQYQNLVKWLVSNELSQGVVLARNETVYGAKEGVKR